MRYIIRFVEISHSFIAFIHILCFDRCRYFYIVHWRISRLMTASVIQRPRNLHMSFVFSVKYKTECESGTEN